MRTMTGTTTMMISMFVLLLSLCSLLVSALPPVAIHLRSADSNQDVPLVVSDEEDRPMHLADGILCDLMMGFADENHDSKLSANEIAWFYEQIVSYTPFVSRTYGESFIIIADRDGDNLLDRDELLRMLVAMDASDWTRR